MAESFLHVYSKIVLIFLLLVIIAVIIVYAAQYNEIEELAQKETIEDLYNKIQPGDILILRLSSLMGRITMSPISKFFHYAIVVQLPYDSNKYIFHTRNKAIQPFIKKELPHNVITLGSKGNYQLVELENYLTYIKKKEEYFIHLKSHSGHDYTFSPEMANTLDEWTGYIGSKNCTYLMMTLLKQQGWTSQTNPHYDNCTYYSPISVQERLIEYDHYTEKGIFQPVSLETINKISWK